MGSHVTASARDRSRTAESVAGTGPGQIGPGFCLSGTGPGQPGPVPEKPGPMTSIRLPYVRVHVRIADLAGGKLCLIVVQMAICYLSQRIS